MRNGEEKGIEKNVLQGLYQKFDCYYECPKEMGRNNDKNLQISINSVHIKVSCEDFFCH